MSYLLACGCSFTDPTFSTNKYTLEEMQQMGHGYRLGYWKMWPEYLGEKLNLESKNYGESGASNQKISLRAQHYSSYQKPELVAILWSQWQRFSILGLCTNMFYVWRIHLASVLLLSHYELSVEDISFENDHFIKECLSYIRLRWPDKIESLLNYYSNTKIKDLFVKMSAEGYQDNYKSHLFISCWHAFSKSNWETKNGNNRSTHCIDVTQLISEALLPIINIINYCKINNIKLIMEGGCEWDDSIWGENIFGKKIDKSIINENCSDYYYEINAISEFYELLEHTMLEHPLFYEIEDAINDKSVGCRSWPFGRKWGGYVSRNFSGFRIIGTKDTHPGPAGQAAIGNFMYETYKKTFT